jgi:hypothetical protein
LWWSEQSGSAQSSSVQVVVADDDDDDDDDDESSSCAACACEFAWECECESQSESLQLFVSSFSSSSSLILSSLIICFGDVTLPNSTSSIIALLLICLANIDAILTCSGPAISILFNNSISAASICSANNSGTLRCDAQLSWISLPFSSTSPDDSTHPSRSPTASLYSRGKKRRKKW